MSFCRKITFDFFLMETRQLYSLAKGGILRVKRCHGLLEGSGSLEKSASSHEETGRIFRETCDMQLGGFRTPGTAVCRLLRSKESGFRHV